MKLLTTIVRWFKHEHKWEADPAPIWTGSRDYQWCPQCKKVRRTPRASRSLNG